MQTTCAVQTKRLHSHCQSVTDLPTQGASSWARGGTMCNNNTATTREPRAPHMYAQGSPPSVDTAFRNGFCVVQGTLAAEMRHENDHFATLHFLSHATFSTRSRHTQLWLVNVPAPHLSGPIRPQQMSALLHSLLVLVCSAQECIHGGLEYTVQV